MKTTTKIMAIFLIFLTISCAAPQKGYVQQGEVSLQIFYDNLSPYGQWAHDPDYGYVWIPKVHQGFSPYGSDGHWIFTDQGWAWVSNYSWGWAPFHYGRWRHDPYHGWMWIPDTEWGPAWVSWRRSEGYYGWAPLGPGISINIAISGGYNIPDEHWIFVKDRDIERHDVNKYYVNKTNNVTIIKNSTVINNTYVDNSRHVTYIAGPNKDDVQKITGKTVKPVVIKDNDKPGQKVNNDELKIYRPQVKKTNKDGKEPAPAKVVPLQKEKPDNNKPGNN